MPSAFTVWLVGKRMLTIAEKRLAAHPIVKAKPRIFVLVRRWLQYTVVLATGTFFIHLFNIQAIENAFIAAIIIGLAFPLKEFLSILLDYLHGKTVAKTETQVDDILFELLDRFAGVIIFSWPSFWLSTGSDINIMPFIAGAGVAGIAIGFAAKDTLSNLISGVLLIIDRPFEIGDRIEVWSAPKGSSTWGDVIDIGLRATQIRTTDNIVIIIPNNQVMTRDIVNYTTISSGIRVRVNIGVAYDTDLEKAKQTILEVAESVEWIAKDPPPKVVVRNFGESSVDLQLRVWIEDARKRMDTISAITDQVKSAFDAAGIEIPYPKRDLHITRIVQHPAPSGAYPLLPKTRDKA